MKGGTGDSLVIILTHRMSGDVSLLGMRARRDQGWVRLPPAMGAIVDVDVGGGRVSRSHLSDCFSRLHSSSCD